MRKGDCGQGIRGIQSPKTTRNARRVEKGRRKGGLKRKKIKEKVSRNVAAQRPLVAVQPAPVRKERKKKGGEAGPKLLLATLSPAELARR